MSFSQVNMNDKQLGALTLVYWLVCIGVATKVGNLPPNYASALLIKLQAIPVGAKPTHIHL